MLDPDIRPLVIDDIEHADCDAAIFHELPLSRGRGRADIAAVNGHMVGYEIKSERDSLARLPQQVQYYELVFDYSNVVVELKHLKHVRKVIPQRWGIKVIRNRSDGAYLEHVRTPHRNCSLSPDALVRILWKPEAISLMREHGLDITHPAMPVRIVWDTLLSELTTQELSDGVRLALKARRVSLTA